MDKLSGYALLQGKFCYEIDCKPRFVKHLVTNELLAEWKSKLEMKFAEKLP